MKSDIKLSEAFKKQTTKAILSIGFFALVYLIILASAIALTALCIYGGLMLIAAMPKFITIVLGIGLAGLGIMILVFLFKFMFKTHKTDRSHLVEITQSEEPALFQMVHEIVDEVGTKFPKKVYLSPDVNAAVFYDSSFWSMFLPVRKNLQIGLGLVNVVTKAELKAILSHEFGHFAQKTMKVGSYVYNVNQVIYNMLYDNSSFESAVQTWANISSSFAIFVGIGAKIIRGIQWILQKMYGVVNLAYMGLSREMEFHADEIAANVTGYEPLASSLLRLNLAEFSFNSAIEYYQRNVSNNLKSENIFLEQGAVMNFIAREDGLPVENSFPVVSSDVMNRFNKSKLVIKDQWASHPSSEERIVRMEQLGINTSTSENGPANELFSNVEKLQEKFTENMFKDVFYSGPPQIKSKEEFQTVYIADYRNNTFDKVYNGYYDNKNPEELDILGVYNVGEIRLEDLFSPEKIDTVYTSIALQNDIETLTQISRKDVSIKTFDYDNEKFRKQDSLKLVDRLNIQLVQIKEIIRNNDIRIFVYFGNLEKDSEQSGKLSKLYEELYKTLTKAEFNLALYNKILADTQFLNQPLAYKLIRENFLKLKDSEEDLKREIRSFLKDGAYSDEMSKEQSRNLANYVSNNLTYFQTDHYLEENLQIFYSAVNDFQFLSVRSVFLKKKELLEYQSSLLKEAGISRTSGVSSELKN